MHYERIFRNAWSTKARYTKSITSQKHIFLDVSFFNNQDVQNFFEKI